MEETGKNPIQVAARLFQVIELLAEHGPMGIMEISASWDFIKARFTGWCPLCSSWAISGRMRKR